MDDRSDHLEGSSDHLEGSSDHLEELIKIAKPVREKRKTPPELTKKTLLELCKEEYLTQEQLAEILIRSPHTLRKFLKELVEDRSLVMKYPSKPNYPDQAYKTNHQV